MKFLSWNVHGLENPRGIRTLHDLIKKGALDIVFLQETRLQVCDFGSCKFMLGFSNYLAVSSEGRSGSIAMLWGWDVNLMILNYSKSHIDACVTVDGTSTDKHVNEAWLVFGDFNEILYQQEKWGGRNKLERHMLDFCNVVNDCLVRDIGFSGPKFTWYNGKEASSRINVRLDRFFGNPQWWNRFAQARVIHERATSSDHIPIWLHSEVVAIERRMEKLLRFEAMWLGERGCDNIVEATWSRGTKSNAMVDLMHKISDCGQRLQA
ncbi:hypothetical protein I3760_07G057900 [Carya illinoinensis]|nr:hypothetical protein I3760_07G057900 [Carya illinoinensis]